ncbi:MAG: putative hydrolase [Phycisphaerales bacterium]|jgi:8-oxo-dGTP pyrophosphatase MutT (NUDIX family)|nr:putative hydrolase [Phycisphaerales bacterium]MDB5355462.1 putative hydrolase [Phycisphaerales bacterium]
MAREERSAGFIIFFRPGADGPRSEPEFLLLDYGRHWDFAKGHVEAGEDDLAAARRELLEETGIANARVIPGFHQEITYYFRHKRRGLVRKTVIFFLAQTPTRDVKLSKEHTAYDFLPYEAAIKKVTYPTAKQVLRAAWEHVKSREE